MKPIIAIIFTSLILTACTPTKRLERLISRHPYLISTVDTIVVHNQTPIPEIQIKEKFVTLPQDTIRIDVEKENLKIKIIRQYDTIFAEVTRPPDTIRTEIRIPVEVIRQETPSVAYMFWKRFPWLIIGLVFILATINWLFSKR